MGANQKIDREVLQEAICKGLQKTTLYCPHTTKAICGAKGDCAYCAAIANEVDKLNYIMEKRGTSEIVRDNHIAEAGWVDVTKPGQITCGGNPVYACSRCGFVYGSFQLFPSANYCENCGAKMKGVYGNV